MVQADQASEDTQLIVEEVGTDGFHIKSVSTGMYLTLRANSIDINNNPITYDPLNSNYHQLWRYDEGSYGWGNVEVNSWMDWWANIVYGYHTHHKQWNQRFEPVF